MKGHLFVFVGPPKTGTTSLQLALEEFSNGRFVYGGSFQPRRRNKDSLACRVHDWILSQQVPSLEPDDALPGDLANAVSNDGFLVLSEEMFTVTSVNMSWVDKIGELGRLLAGLPVTIIVTLRNPNHALPSLYQELFHELSFREQCSYAVFCKGEAARCYDYDFLEQLLVSSGLSNIRYLDFEALKKNALTTRHLFGEKDTFNAAPINVGSHNLGSKSKTSALIREIPPVRVLDVLRNSFLGQFLPTIRSEKSGAMYGFYERLCRIELRRGGYKALKCPADRLSALTKSYLRLLGQIDSSNLT